MTIVIRPDGAVHCMYSDALDVRSLGSALGAAPKITRASMVEPTTDGQWTADLAPSNGPELGPFSNRAEALAAESAWIDANVLGGVG